MKNRIMTQGGIWRRATQTQQLSEYPEWTRPYHLEMPPPSEDISSLMDYTNEQELAFCLPVAYPELAENAIYRFEGYCKAALYLARQMLHHWDVRAMNVPIFIGVSENGLDIFKDYAAHCNFPESHIVTLPSYANEEGGWTSKFDLLCHPRLAPIRRRVHVDASLWLRPEVPYRHACEELLKAWHTQDFLITTWTFINADIDEPWTLAVQSFAEAGFYDKLAALLETTADAEATYWAQENVEYVQGYLFGLSREVCDDAVFRKTLTDLRTITIHDEVILAILARELRWSAENAVRSASHYLQDLQYMPAFSSHSDEAEALELMEVWREVQGYDVTSLRESQISPG